MVQAFSPSQLGNYLNQMIKKDGILSNIIIEGEVSDYTCSSRGHHYFSLKDGVLPEGSQYGTRSDAGMLSGVLFQGDTGFITKVPEKGMKLRAFGQISVYAGRSNYQLICKRFEILGLGDAHQLFLEMEKKLGQQGLFHPSHKKRIPWFPRSAALVTAKTGDAVHDMIDALQGRCPGVQLKVVPVAVQGVTAETEIALAIQWVNQHRVADVILVGRGGGSEEDLKAFNTEPLAHAIFNSRIPVISAVGHQKNQVISDRVADDFAETPSRVKDKFIDVGVERKKCADMERYLEQLMERILERKALQLQQMSQAAVLQNPNLIFEGKAQVLSQMDEVMNRCMLQMIERIQYVTQGLERSLEDLSPKKVLQRGYALALEESGGLISSVSQLESGKTFTLVLGDGEVQCEVKCVPVADDK